MSDNKILVEVKNLKEYFNINTGILCNSTTFFCNL